MLCFITLVLYFLMQLIKPWKSQYLYPLSIYEEKSNIFLHIYKITIGTG